ncbi:MAG TPA: hypothetical protein VFA52_00515 [Candidatus Paceibacterota bacterium]|nr:hypothetical protein [Candidatus Paceibacterota bacterium]
MREDPPELSRKLQKAVRMMKEDGEIESIEIEGTDITLWPIESKRAQELRNDSRFLSSYYSFENKTVLRIEGKTEFD